MTQRILLLFAIALTLAASPAAADDGPGAPVRRPASGSSFQDFLDRVNNAIYPDRPGIVDSFLAAVPSIPFVEDSVAHFLYRGAVTSVTVPGDANGWDIASFPMVKLSSTDLWYVSQTFERDARLDYKFVLNGSNWILDPRNPHTVSGGFGPNSELAMPDYVQPWDIAYRAGAKHGRSESLSLHSGIRGTNYTVQVFLPFGYDSTSAAYPSVYFQDGGEYVSLGSSINVLNNLIDSGLVRPLIAVFVTPINRNGEYAGSLRNDYMNFFVSELVPYIDAHYRTIAEPRFRAVLGDSYGGNISGLISYTHPEVFGNCGLHSAAFQPNSYEVYNLIAGGSSKSDSLRFAGVWGTYELPIPQVMHAFRDSLTAKGYYFPTRERHEGHSWGLWRATTSFLLESFFPNVTSVRPDRPRPLRAVLYQNYPNPFNPGTMIRYDLPSRARVRLTVVDLLGRVVATLSDNVQEAGSYETVWNAGSCAAGVYFCRIETSGPRGGEWSASVRKLLLVR